MGTWFKIGNSGWLALGLFAAALIAGPAGRGGEKPAKDADSTSPGKKSAAGGEGKAVKPAEKASKTGKKAAPAAGPAAKPDEKAAPADGKAALVDASFGVPVHRPLLCTRTGKMKGEFTLAGRGAGQKVPVASEEVVTFVDQIERASADEEDSTRTFLTVAASTNGEVDDSPLAGIAVAFSRKGKDVNLRINDNRALTQRRINDLLRFSESVGIWMKLPKTASLGTTHEVDLADLAPVMLTGELPVESASASLTLRGVDESGTVSFEGPVKLVERGEIDGNKISSTYDLACVLKVRPREKRIVSLKLEGTFQGEYAGEMQGTVRGKFSSELVTEIGEAVEKALKGKPTYRSRDWTIRQIGLRLALPTSWDRGNREPGMQHFIWTLNADNGTPIMTVGLLGEDASNAKAYFDNLAKALGKGHPDLKVTKVTSGIGAGQAYSFSDKLEGKEYKVRSEFYPHGKGCVLYKLIAESKNFPLALPEFEKARPTLKPIR